MNRANHVFFDFAGFEYRRKQCGFAIIVKFTRSHNENDYKITSNKDT